MNRTYVPTLLLLFVAVLFARCSKTSTNVTPTSSVHEMYYYPDSALSANFRYKSGSYWIYQDSVSGRIDSFYVVSSDSNDLKLISHGMGMTDITHYISYEIKIRQINISGLTGTTPSDWSLKLSNNNARLTHADSGQTSGTLATFLYPLNTAMGYSADSMIIMFNYDYFLTSFNSYDGVVEMKHVTAAENDDFFVTEHGEIVIMNINHPAHGIHQVWVMLRSLVVM